jgi:hypothetical protein
MKRRELNQYKMGTTAAGVLDKNSAVWSGNSIAVAKRGLLASALQKVAEAHQTQETYSAGGERKMKVKAKKYLGEVAELVSSGVKAYAMDTGDNVTRLEFKRGAAGIYKLTDVDCLSICKLLRDYVQAHLTELADYNVDGTLLGKLDGAMATFRAVKGSPRMAETRVMTATKELKAGLQDMLKVLHWWDTFVGTLRVSQKDLYTSYRWSRKTHKDGVRHVSIRGVVRAEGTGTLLFKVKVRVEGHKHVEGEEHPDRVRAKTGKSGKFAVHSLQPGDYTLVFELWGYETLRVENVGVRYREISEIEAKLRMKNEK